jgi:hypothetical protein
VIHEDAKLQVRLPVAFLAQRQDFLDARRPLLATLRVIVTTYQELTNTEEIWATGLGQAP